MFKWLSGLFPKTQRPTEMVEKQKISTCTPWEISVFFSDFLPRKWLVFGGIHGRLNQPNWEVTKLKKEKLWNKAEKHNRKSDSAQISYHNISPKNLDVPGNFSEEFTHFPKPKCYLSNMWGSLINQPWPLPHPPVSAPKNLDVQDW